MSHDESRGSFSGRTFHLLLAAPSYLVLFAFPPVAHERDGPTSLMRGEGHLVGRIPSLRASWVVRVVVEGGRTNPRSTVDTVDLGFKLRSHAQ